MPAIAVLAMAVLACAAPRAGPGGAPAPPGPPLPGPAAALPDQDSPAGTPACDVVTAVVVSKDARRLVAHCRNGGRFETAASFGRGGAGAKECSGDQRTPEGLYHVATPAHSSRFHRFVLLDYPSVADADRALRDGRISEEDHGRIVDAHARGEQPPGDTPLGGDFGLHGEGPRWRDAHPELDWTFGCIAVDDDAIDYLAERLPPGTPVEIRP